MHVSDGCKYEKKYEERKYTKMITEKRDEIKTDFLKF